MMSTLLADFLVRKPEGYYCRYGDFFIDASNPVMHNVVSHAHGDHASSGHDYVYATQATSLFMTYRYKQNRKDSYQVKLFNSPFKIGAVEITFLPAGHILGSAQILMEYRGYVTCTPAIINYKLMIPVNRSKCSRPMSSLRKVPLQIPRLSIPIRRRR
ncbi:hypothetical protein [Sphingobacterium sp. UGAL515B_05]|uniref:hypothetical protein n=1 Tax=Sphingobacterium sp. UGAL515B_05 TaxID=2986767 RepID=UPI002954B167|nr:hypothetical protein [Sphingobacterium sp. UGAL515B_05]